MSTGQSSQTSSQNLTNLLPETNWPAVELTDAEKFQHVEGSKTPCHKCASWDFGCSMYGKKAPEQKCKRTRSFLTTEQALQGCEAFKVKRGKRKD